MKKIVSLFILLFIVFIAKAEQVNCLGKINFLNDPKYFILLPILLNLAIISWLILIEKRLKKEGLKPSDYPNISVRATLIFGFLISQFCYVILEAVFLDSGQRIFSSFKNFFLLFSVCYFIFYVMRITIPFGKTNWGAIKILRFLFVAEFLLLIYNLFDFYFRF